MEEKQVNKWLRHKFSIVGWAILIYYGLMNILVMGTMTVDVMKQYLREFASGNFFPEVDTAALMNNASGYLLTIFLGLLILWAWKGGDYWREILHREAPMKASAFLAMLTLIAGAQLISSFWIGTLEMVMNQFGKSVLDMLDAVSGESSTVSMLLYAAVLAPVSEEILFRGLILRSLRPCGKRFAIFGSALLFALFHGNLLQAPYAFLAGLVLGYCAAEYSLLWSTALHVFNNLVLADLMTRLTGLMPAGAADVFTGLVFWGFAIAAVGILIGKRRQISAYRRAEWMDRRCLKCFFSSPGILVFVAIMGVSMAVSLLML